MATVKLGPTAIRIRNADMANPSGDRAGKVYDNLVTVHGKSLADELWNEALDELDDANGVERSES